MSRPSRPPSSSTTPYITTDTGNLVSRACSINGSKNIVLAGKSILRHGCVVRGDLRRAGAAPGGAKEGGSVVIAIGRYCDVGEGVVLRPCYKTYKGVFSYYPMKIGDHVSIGAGSVVEAASIGTGVEIGKGCIIGPLAILKDYSRIADGAVVGSGTIVPSLTEWAGSPARPVGQLPESTPELVETRAKTAYARFQPE
ncbi:hypothetical protein JCM3775_003830 [Rhodotorula graminis]|uniref:Dynactin subunit 5 n=1 Tax=Rhodotorula graminis (strain WP1) TaxID=578459 RepID=A0A0P9IV71_RHOGW|nr:uncharacterized protein RHOBADRAFT_16944 [Rhodotorula graminis WP1]KPV73503.1 hypothetical protein RHOBADRAFT_16944 [Rhodotorula graminis WP1]